MDPEQKHENYVKDNSIILGRCSSCKYWNTDREEFKSSNKGWGYCTNNAIKTPMQDTEWKNNNELNIKRDSIISSDFKGFLTEENRKKGVVGIFQTGENFGCIHYVLANDDKLK